MHGMVMLLSFISVTFLAKLVHTIMKSTEVQTSPIYRSHALKHIPQSTEPRAVLGSKYAMATPAEFVKLSER